MKIILETISAERVGCLELRICRRIGCISVGFVVVADCHGCAIGECINVSTQYSLNGNYRLSSLCVPPILTDFKHIVSCLATFLHFSHEEEHPQHLVFSASGKCREIVLLLQFPLECFLDLQLCPAMRASASFSMFVQCPTMSTVHTSGTTFWQAVGEVVYALTECPLTLCLGYRAKVLALGKDCLLKFVSRFHRLKNQIRMVVLGLLHSQSSLLVRYGSVSWQVPHADIA